MNDGREPEGREEGEEGRQEQEQQLTRSLMATPMLTPAEGSIAELALVLLLGGEGGFADARRGGAGEDGHAGGHVGGQQRQRTTGGPGHRAMVEIVWLASVGVGLKVRW